LSIEPAFGMPIVSSEGESSAGWKRDLDLTRAGLSLLILGQMVQVILSRQFINDTLILQIVGLTIIIPTLAGGSLLIFGRHSFDKRHYLYATLGLALSLIGYSILASYVSLDSFSLLILPGPESQALYLYFVRRFFILSAATTIITTGNVSFSYALQRSIGKVLLWLGWAASLIVWTQSSPASFQPDSLRVTYGILGFVSPALFIVAYAMAIRQIQRSEKTGLVRGTY
jgi:hypothetical protein